MLMPWPRFLVDSSFRRLPMHKLNLISSHENRKADVDSIAVRDWVYFESFQVSPALLIKLRDGVGACPDSLSLISIQRFLYA
ncbi:hypothetical protein K443DRAFT_381616 [Laccaria amethystina LaAM-08-1]|uniref:Uncharacterized protein n=1 Tax=Laccaria amethystina LaAM-08-1 TaxID=1095629 RepID=A0A0C9XBS0_9AGAR|nr:hypothetical protein K443DRAFT_381616 [Laccaria amethystina LaAM-08-1]